MKKIVFILLISIIASACSELDLNPLAEGSSENWYSNETEITMALNDLYKSDFWFLSSNFSTARWTDDGFQRQWPEAILTGSITGEDGNVNSLWTLSYKAIARANIILENLNEDKVGLPDQQVNKIEAEARFIRACMYSRLISFFGDVVYYNGIIDIDEAFSMGRTDKAIILQEIYNDFDFAINYLPTQYSDSELKRATKGAALGMKARIALYMEDWAIASDAAKSCMDLGVYELYPNYGELFLSKTKNTKEEVWGTPRSVELDEYIGVSNSMARRFISRNAGGFAEYGPTWDLFFSYLMTDGLPVDESPLFDPREPFENRDPRCSATIVPFQTRHLGFMYQPHPDSLNVLNFKTGNYQKNNDTRSNTQYASYNGLLWKKGIDEDWSDDQKTDPVQFEVRYADVLLMYAEAKIELNEIDQSILDAINSVRARAYGVDLNATSDYPEVTLGSQNELRKILRMERRMELAFENLRYMDIIRWRLAEKVIGLNDNYGMLNPDELREKVIQPGLWFFPGVPEVDEDGIVNLKPFYDQGLIRLLLIRDFDKTKQYLWPIPSKEVQINSNLIQNPGY